MTSLFSDFVLGHVQIYAQPIISVSDNKVCFYEILSRVHYKNKIFMPNQFFPDMNVPMKLTLAQHLFTSIGLFQQQDQESSFSINISALEIDQYLDKFLIGLCESKKIDSSRCIIEITEHAAFDDEKIYTILKKLKYEYGFRFAVDDFGVKYSVLAHIIKRGDDAVFDYIKIDGSIIKGIEKDLCVFNTLAHLIRLIKENGKKIIVEYIANENIYNIVTGIKPPPEYLQGFYISEPKPISFFLNNKIKLKDLNAG